MFRIFSRCFDSNLFITINTLFVNVNSLRLSVSAALFSFHKHESLMSSQLTQREITSFWQEKPLLVSYFREKSGEFCRKVVLLQVFASQ